MIGVVSTIAIVGYCDLATPQAEDTLRRHCQSPRFHGVRQVLNHHPTNPIFSEAPHDKYLTDPQWLKGVSLLQKFGLSFELHILPCQMHRYVYIHITEQGFKQKHSDSCYWIPSNYTGVPVTAYGLLNYLVLQLCCFWPNANVTRHVKRFSNKIMDFMVNLSSNVISLILKCILNTCVQVYMYIAGFQ